LADVVVELRCRRCRPHADGLIVTTTTTTTRAWWDAVDHALDKHRAQLVATPDDTQHAFTSPSSAEWSRRCGSRQRVDDHGRQLELSAVDIKTFHVFVLPVARR